MRHKRKGGELEDKEGRRRGEQGREEKGSKWSKSWNVFYERHHSLLLLYVYVKVYRFTTNIFKNLKISTTFIARPILEQRQTN